MFKVSLKQLPALTYFRINLAQLGKRVLRGQVKTSGLETGGDKIFIAKCVWQSAGTLVLIELLFFSKGEKAYGFDIGYLRGLTIPHS
jgi:hypothetical protein